MPRVDPRVPALVAIGSAAIALLGVYQTWLRISVGGVTGPGSAQSGWDGRDGLTVVAAAAIVTVVGLLLLIGRSEPWLRNTLFIAGATTVVIALVNAVGAGSKANDIHVRYSIATSDVHAEVGAGVWLVALAGAGTLVAALLAHTFKPTEHF